MSVQRVNEAEDFYEVPVREPAGKFSYLKVQHPVTEKADDVIAQPNRDIPTSNLKVRTSMSSADAGARPIASFYVDPHDELELEQFKAGAPDVQTKARTLLDEAEALRRHVVPELPVNLRHQFNSVVASFWREVRGSLELREVLMRDKGLGGLSLDEASVDKVVKAAEAELKGVSVKLKSGELQIRGSDQGSEVSDILEFDSQPAKAAATQVTEGEGLADEQFDQPKQELPAVPSGDLKLSTELKSRTPAKQFSPGSPQTDSIVRARAGVELPQVTTGPIEELEKMSLEELRRLDKDPVNAAQKVFQKVDLLGDESIELKAQGIAAWHKSPLYSNYVEVGHKSMESGESVGQVITDNLAKDQGALTMAEFDAMADMNRYLNF